MKINEKHIASLIRQPYVRDNFINLQIQNAKNDNRYELSDSEIKEYVNDKFSGIFNQKNKPYLLKKTALQIVDKIKIDKNFHPKIFNKFEDGFKGTIIVDENNLFLFWRDDKMIRGMEIIYNPQTTMVNYNSFGMVIESGAYSQNYNEIKNSFEKFIKLLIFLYFADIETVELKPNGKYGTIHTERWKNESNTTFIIVDSTWNKTIIRNDGFTVSGHLRLQPCGFGMLDRKLIFIKEYEKSGYVRKAKSEQTNERIEQ